MRARSDVWRVVILLSCHLTLVASGDDFCLLRVIFPSLFATVRALPLDDPKTDFLEAAGPLAAPGSGEGSWCDTGPAYWPCPAGDAPLATGQPPCLAAFPTGHLYLPDCTGLNPPLRC